jgi:hypothetical protein
MVLRRRDATIRPRDDAVLAPSEAHARAALPPRLLAEC